MKSSSTLLCALTLMLGALNSSHGQGVIGGSQNGLGPGGYLPKPPIIVEPVVPIGPIQFPPPPKESRITAALSLAGYEFDVVQISGQPIKVVIDPPSPAAVPLADATAKKAATGVALGLAPGFWATFVIANTSPNDRDFVFPVQYYADNKVTFSVIDENGDQVWTSLQILVDIPPLAPKVHQTLKKNHAWRNQVYVPLLNLPDGHYTLQATFNGSPFYAASGAFIVKNVVVGVGLPTTNPTK